jgi:hypothetical protein
MSQISGQHKEAIKSKQSADLEGLYLFEHEGWREIGLTAREVQERLDSERFTEAKVYRICRAFPDGTLELKGVSRDKFQLESIMVFVRGMQNRTDADFEDMRNIAKHSAPPCKMVLQQAVLDKAGDKESHLSAIAIIYPAEYEQEVGRWLLRNDFRGGDQVYGGQEGWEKYHAYATIIRSETLFSGGKSADREDLTGEGHAASA